MKNHPLGGFGLVFAAISYGVETTENWHVWYMYPWNILSFFGWLKGSVVIVSKNLWKWGELLSKAWNR